MARQEEEAIIPTKEKRERSEEARDDSQDFRKLHESEAFQTSRVIGKSQIDTEGSDRVGPVKTTSFYGSKEWNELIEFFKDKCRKWSRLRQCCLGNRALKTRWPTSSIQLVDPLHWWKWIVNNDSTHYLILYADCYCISKSIFRCHISQESVMLWEAEKPSVIWNISPWSNLIAVYMNHGWRQSRESGFDFWHFYPLSLVIAI